MSDLIGRDAVEIDILFADELLERRVSRCFGGFVIIARDRHVECVFGEARDLEHACKAIGSDRPVSFGIDPLTRALSRGRHGIREQRTNIRPVRGIESNFGAVLAVGFDIEPP